MKKYVMVSCVIGLCICLSAPIHVEGSFIQKEPLYNNDLYKETLLVNKISYANNDTTMSYCYALTLNISENLSMKSRMTTICNLVNDLLTQGINVYRATSSFSAASMHPSDSFKKERTFSSGTFLIPFTGNISTDVLLSCIISEYYHGHTIDYVNSINPYYILEPITLSVLPLSLTHIAYYFGSYISHLSLLYYLEPLVSAGFFDYKILTDETIQEELQNTSSNLLLWPGANLAVPLHRYFQTGFSVETNSVIKSFVENGGGYIGSCYGASMVSSGPVFPIMKALPDTSTLSSVMWLSMIPSSVFPLGYGGINTISFEDINHPLFFGVPNQTQTFHSSSVAFPWVGNEVNILGRVSDMKVVWYYPLIPQMPSKWLDWYFQKCLHMPMWLTNTYGKGKLVVFGDHPEMLPSVVNTKIIHNAVYYSTGQKERKQEISIPYTISFLNYILSVGAEVVLQNHTHKESSLTQQTEKLLEKSRQIDEIKKTRFLRSQQLRADRKISTHEFMLFETPTHDSFEQWTQRFLDIIPRMERVMATTNIKKTDKKDYETWNNTINSLLSLLLSECDDIISMGANPCNESTLFSIVPSIDMKHMLCHAEDLEQNIKKTYASLIQLYPLTKKTMRSWWYHYEKGRVLEKISPPSSTLPVKPAVHTFKDNMSQILYVQRGFLGGNGSKQAPLHSIQDAIDIAVPHSTIYVLPGVYAEKIIVSKPLILKGYDKQTTIIEGGKSLHHTVFVYAENVTMQGFTIRNTSRIRYSCGICLYSCNNTICDNIFTKNCVGLGLSQSASFNAIYQNEFYENSFIGAAIDETLQRENTFANNYFHDNDYYGLYLLNSQNSVKENIFTNDGITLFSDRQEIQITFENNTINEFPVLFFKNQSDITIDGKTLGCGIFSNCSRIQITNTSFNQIDTGLQFFDCQNITIQQCLFSDCINGITFWHCKDGKITNSSFDHMQNQGLRIQYSTNICFNDNWINTSRIGMFLQESRNLQITKNTLQHNDIGVSLWMEKTPFNPSRNKFIKNVFIENNQHAYAVGRNSWYNNYFDDWLGLYQKMFRLFPYFIAGMLGGNIEFSPAAMIG